MEPKHHSAWSMPCKSQQVKDFMTESYGGAVVSAVEDPTDGWAILPSIMTH